jgi:protein-disulfide isomerase
VTTADPLKRAFTDALRRFQCVTTDMSLLLSGHLTSRRRYLLGAAGLVAGTAGCIGGSSEPNPSGETVDSLPVPRDGSEDAPVTLSVFVDFECPHCHTFKQETLPPVREEYISTGDVAYLHGDFPIPVSDWSQPAAMAARAVQAEAGAEAFWAYSEKLYRNQGNLDYPTFADLADSLEADVDGTTIEQMTRDAQTWPVVEASRATAEDAGITGTPGVLVNGEYVESQQDRPYIDVIRAAIDRAL